VVLIVGQCGYGKTTKWKGQVINLTLTFFFGISPKLLKVQSGPNQGWFCLNDPSPTSSQWCIFFLTSTCALQQIVGIKKEIFFIYDTWRYTKNCGNASNLKKRSESRKHLLCEKVAHICNFYFFYRLVINSHENCDNDHHIRWSNRCYLCNFWFYGDSKRIIIFLKYTFCRNYHFFLNRSNFHNLSDIFIVSYMKKSLFLYLQFATNHMSIF